MLSTAPCCAAAVLFGRRRGARASRAADTRVAAVEGDGEGESEAGGGVSVEEATLTGAELRALVVEKWGRSYDTRLCQRRDRFNEKKMYLQVMWKFVGQRSFPMTEQQYIEQLDAVAELLTEWGVVEAAVKGIKACKEYPVLDTVGAHAIMIPLPVGE